MRSTRSHLCVAAAAYFLSTVSGYALASELQGVPNANPKLPGITAPDILSPELRHNAVAEGSLRVENPSDPFGFYGFGADGPHTQAPGALPFSGCLVVVSLFVFVLFLFL